MTRLAALFLAAAAGFLTVGGAQQRPPNIVFILADDLGYGELGSYGQQKIRTPRLDRMASEGMRFTQFYSGSPVCAPSRSAFVSGLHTGHTHVRDNHEMGGFLDEEERGQLALPPDYPTVARWLKQHGYSTAVVGKWGLGGPGANWDMWATFAELAGSEPPRDTDGVSILPTLLGRDGQREHEALYWEYHSQGSAQAVRMGRWKGVRINAAKTPDGPIELYDLDRDPRETANVADANPDVVLRIREILRRSHTPAVIPRWNFSRP